MKSRTTKTTIKLYTAQQTSPRANRIQQLSKSEFIARCCMPWVAALGECQRSINTSAQTLYNSCIFGQNVWILTKNYMAWLQKHLFRKFWSRFCNRF